jgi:ribose transport system permease protein
MTVTEQSSTPEARITPSSSAPLAQRNRRADVLQFTARYGLVIFLLILIVIFSILEPKTFPTTTMFKTILEQQTVIMLLALSVLPIVVVGEFDLSVGYVLGLCAVVIAALGGEAHINGVLTLLLTILIACAIGVLNGILVGAMKIPSMIATLGVGLAVGGLTVGVSGGRTLVAGIPTLIPDLSTTEIFSLSSAVWIVAGISIIAYAIFAHTPTGRRMYAVGGSQVVARLAGIRTIRLKIIAFAAGGALVAIAGALELGQAGGANPSFGPSLLLPAYAAVFLGSTTIRPGFFNVWGTVIATLVLAVGFTGLNLVGVPFWTQPVFNGGALVIGVLLSRGEVRRAGR